MNILFLQKKANTGGSKESLLHTLRLLGAAGHRVAVLCSDRGDFTERLDAGRIPCFMGYVPEYRKLSDRIRFRRLAAGLLKPLPDRDFDWVISNEMWWGPAAAALAEAIGCRSGVVLRDTLSGPGKLAKYDLHRLDRVLCINPVMTEWVNALHPDRGHACSIYNPVALPPADPDHVRHWQDVTGAWPGVERLFLMTGSLCPRKNQIDAVHALHRLGRRLTVPSGILFAGSGSTGYVAALRAVCRELAVSRRVLMPGHVGDIRALLSVADGFLFTSRREGLPRSIIEALQAGVPAFCYPLPGLDSIFGDVHDLFVAPEPTPQALCDTLCTALADETLPAHVAGLQERMNRQFSEQQHLHTLLSALE